MKKSTKAVLGLCSCAAAAGAAVLKGVSGYAIDSHMKISERHFTRNTLPEYAGDAEQVYIKNADGMTLCGHYLRAADPKRIVIACHGWRSSWEHDFFSQCGMLKDLGCSVLYIDQRSHGKSDGRYIGFGVLERFDCLKWLEYVENNNPDGLPVYLMGVSMGATTVMLTSELIGSGRVRGIIADCGFTSAGEIWRHEIEQKYRRGAGAMYRFYDMHCKRLAGYRGDTRSTVQALKNTDIPLLFFHGSEDTFVPTQMSRINYEACVSPKRLVIIDGAKHARSCLVDPELYRSELIGFFEEYDKPGTGLQERNE